MEIVEGHLLLLVSLHQLQYKYNYQTKVNSCEKMELIHIEWSNALGCPLYDWQVVGFNPNQGHIKDFNYGTYCLFCQMLNII